MSTQKEHKKDIGWDGILIDAKARLKEVSRQARKLRKVIADLETKARRGEPLPEYLKRPQNQENASTHN